MKKLIAAIVLCLPLAGCYGVPKSHIVAERAIYEAVEPDFRKYVEADQNLSDPQKEAKMRTFVLWDKMLKEWEK